jgi:hypothetical protein
MMDALFVLIQIALFIASIYGLKLFLHGQGKSMGRNE